MMPTFELNMNLNIRAVTVIGIIQGIMSRPRIGLREREPRVEEQREREADDELEYDAADREDEGIPERALEHPVRQERLVVAEADEGLPDGMLSVVTVTSWMLRMKLLTIGYPTSSTM